MTHHDQPADERDQTRNQKVECLNRSNSCSQDEQILAGSERTFETGRDSTATGRVIDKVDKQYRVSQVSFLLVEVALVLEPCFKSCLRLACPRAACTALCGHVQLCGRLQAETVPLLTVSRKLQMPCGVAPTTISWPVCFESFRKYDTAVLQFCIALLVLHAMPQALLSSALDAELRC